LRLTFQDKAVLQDLEIVGREGRPGGRDVDDRFGEAGGGRYDQLLKMLGAPRDVPAVGCAIRSERVLAARRKTGAL